jgi:hypothetical protein
LSVQSNPPLFVSPRPPWLRQKLHSNSKLLVLQVFFFFCRCWCSFLIKVLGAINRHRSGEGQARPPHSTTRTTYVNPSYKPPSKAYVRPEYQASGVNTTTSSRSSTTVRPPSGPGPSQSSPHDVTIDGVVFESSKRSLVRKDSASITFLAQPFVQQPSPVMPSAKPTSSGARPRVQSQYSRNRLDGGPRTRVYKPKGPSRSHLKLDNTRRAYRFVMSMLFSPSESSNVFIDHNVIMARRNTSTSLVLGLRPPVRSQPTPPHL